MSTDEIKKNSRSKHDDTLKPVSAENLIEPKEEIQETSPEREHKIKNYPGKLGVFRDIAERMLDVTGGRCGQASVLCRSKFSICEGVNNG